jgi:predicted TIM-barrel fold metal-dependent hydrolase
MSLTVSARQFSLSGGITDCHVHIFEARSLFPMQVEPAYEPPLSPVSALLDMADVAGVSRFVLVQPTPYGDDLSLLQASLAALGPRARGIGVAGRSAGTADLARMNEAGIAGLRFVETRLADGSRMPGTVPLDTLCDSLAPRLGELGMHAELWAPLSRTLSQWPRLEKAGIPIVLDHMAGFNPAAGRDHEDFQRLLAMLREGAVWVKLALCRRAVGADYEVIRPFHDAMIEANSDRLLWASDFPFVRYPGTPPTVPGLLERFCHWVTDEAVAHRILVQNPARLYRFGTAAGSSGHVGGC